MTTQDDSRLLVEDLFAMSKARTAVLNRVAYLASGMKGDELKDLAWILYILDREIEPKEFDQHA